VVGWLAQLGKSRICFFDGIKSTSKPSQTCHLASPYAASHTTSQLISLFSAPESWSEFSLQFYWNWCEYDHCPKQWLLLCSPICSRGGWQFASTVLNDEEAIPKRKKKVWSLLEQTAIVWCLQDRIAIFYVASITNIVKYMYRKVIQKVGFF